MINDELRVDSVHTCCRGDSRIARHGSIVIDPSLLPERSE